MLLNFPQRKFTPIRHNRTPLKQEPKPERFTFSSSRSKKAPLFEATNTYFPKIAEPQIFALCQKASQKSIGSNKMCRVVLSSQKRLQFGRKNSAVKKFPQNIFNSLIAIESIKRLPSMFVDVNGRRRTFFRNQTPDRQYMKTRSISQSPIAFSNNFSRKSSKNCPEQFFNAKDKGSMSTIPYLASISTSPSVRSKVNSQRITIKISDFKKGKLLGKGYFGEVYIVMHMQTGFICALKILSKQKIKAEKVQESLLREIKIHSFMNHENVINMYGILEDEANIYILQELAQDSLYSILTKHKNLKQLQAVPYIRQTLKGLQYLHSHNIIHRDIKPQNILICYDGKVKICDFGWAVYEPLGMRKSNIGTLLYLSPENIIGKGYDYRHDVWAAGIMSYELLTGSIPFNIWVEEQKSKILTDDIHFPQYIEVSKRAQAFVFRMLQKEPTRRASIQSLLEDSFLKNIPQL